jgi:hypothetical protein
MFNKPSTRRGPDAGTFAFVRAVRPWRWWEWALFNLGILTAVLVGYLHISSPPPAISVESYDRIQMGMNWREVHDIVRAKPGGYGLYWGSDNHSEVGTRDPVRWDKWGAHYGVLEVGYDADGLVCRKVLWHAPIRNVPHPETWSWWVRQAERTVPTAETPIVFSPF